MRGRASRNRPCRASCPSSSRGSPRCRAMSSRTSGAACSCSRRSCSPIETPDAAIQIARPEPAVEHHVDAGVRVKAKKETKKDKPVREPVAQPPPVVEDKTPGTLSIDAEPYATIFIDDSKFGVTP